jgi:hypothetical protein
MYCSKCGNKIEESYKFCVNCGNSVSLNEKVKILFPPIIIAIFLWLLGIGIMIICMFWLFNFELSLDRKWDVIWFIVKILIILFLPFRAFEDLVDKIKEKKLSSFLYDNLFFVIFILALIWFLFTEGMV